jgi:hypothetical protein
MLNDKRLNNYLQQAQKMIQKKNQHNHVNTMFEYDHEQVSQQFAESESTPYYSQADDFQAESLRHTQNSNHDIQHR